MIGRRRFLSSSFFVGIPFFASSNICFLKTTEADDYAETLWEKVRPGKIISFPNDHGSHPSFRLEWWYLTGWLNDMSSSYGFQVTFFRLGTRYRFQKNTSFDSSQIVFVHCSISDPNQNRLFAGQKIGLPYLHCSPTRMLVPLLPIGVPCCSCSRMDRPKFGKVPL